MNRGRPRNSWSTPTTPTACAGPAGDRSHVAGRYWAGSERSTSTTRAGSSAPPSEMRRSAGSSRPRRRICRQQCRMGGLKRRHPPAPRWSDLPHREHRRRREAVTAAELAEQLLRAAHDSANPTAFEHAARDAFAFLGFDAVWHGGAGRTDVLLTAPLGSQEQYRVVVDTKSTSNEAVQDQQIDWVTIDEHQDRYEADHACIVAPAFRGGRLVERARSTRSVALLDVGTLSDILRQHEVAPLDLASYRALFDPAQGSDEVIDQGEVSAPRTRARRRDRAAGGRARGRRGRRHGYRPVLEP
jgi:hypothetical protein